ncbi:MAG: uroporphyrinogen-III C-methyltransferase [Acidimicrobiales bacterium]|nr:uroporphyrinogen-III C-methyltransferase [Acidimicrobiales bacterium]
MAAGFPISLVLAGRPVLVVGGGRVAAAKARQLVEAGAQVTMVAPRFCAEAEELTVRRVPRTYRHGDLDGCWLVVTAVDDAEVTAAVAADAEAARVFCNAADRPEHCSATLMALHRRGEVTVAVSTNGRSPAAAGWLRDRLAGALDARTDRVVRAAAAARDRLRVRRSSEGLPWRALLDEVAAIDDDAEASSLVDRFVSAATAPTAPIAPTAPVGRVKLVGAGPGDPDLLTVAAVAALRWADVVVHDALVGDEIFRSIPAGTELIDVGKRPGRPVPQETIGALLVQLARSGRRVVRLKGGDPYVFGRGGEEALALGAAGVDYDVVPGVSAALAAPAAAGVPVTHRGVAAAVTVITGHRARELAAVDWAAAARLGGTLVVLMGVTERAAIAEALQAGGLNAATPVAVVERAGRPDQRVARARLDELGVIDVVAPATIVIGAVASLDLRSPGGPRPRLDGRTPLEPDAGTAALR